MPSVAKQRTVYSKKTRVNGVTGDQTVKATAGVLGRIIAKNITAAATITVKDGAGTFAILDIPVTTTPVVVPFDVMFGTSIIVNPSATTIDALVIYD